MYRDIEELPIKRRAYERHDVALPVQYRTFLGAGSPSKGALTGTLSVDIGAGGLRIVSEEFLPVSSNVIVHMSSTLGDTPIERLCEVVCGCGSCRPVSPPKFYGGLTGRALPGGVEAFGWI